MPERRPAKTIRFSRNARAGFGPLAGGQTRPRAAGRCHRTSLAVVSAAPRHCRSIGGLADCVCLWSGRGSVPSATPQRLPTSCARPGSPRRVPLAGPTGSVAVTTVSRWCPRHGVPVKGLEDSITSPYRVGPQVFSHTLASTDNIHANYFGLTCIPDGITVYPAAEDGVYLLLAPLSAGQHTIHLTIESCHHDITYHLTVN
jgi:hypothetical protein